MLTTALLDALDAPRRPSACAPGWPSAGAEARDATRPARARWLGPERPGPGRAARARLHAARSRPRSTPLPRCAAGCPGEPDGDGRRTAEPAPTAAAATPPARWGCGSRCRGLGGARVLCGAARGATIEVAWVDGTPPRCTPRGDDVHDVRRGGPHRRGAGGGPVRIELPRGRRGRRCGWTAAAISRRPASGSTIPARPRWSRGPAVQVPGALRMSRATHSLVVLAALGAARGAPPDIRRSPTPALGRCAEWCAPTDDASAAPLPYAMVELVVTATRTGSVLADSAAATCCEPSRPGCGACARCTSATAARRSRCWSRRRRGRGGPPARAASRCALAALTRAGAAHHATRHRPRTLRPSRARVGRQRGRAALAGRGHGDGRGGRGAAAAAARDGGNDPADPRDVLLMRGSTTDLKLVLLDGAPVYTPFHLGGLLPSFDPTTIGRRGAARGRRARRATTAASRTSSTCARARRGATRSAAAAALDLMSAQASLEGPLGAHAGVLVAGRVEFALAIPGIP